MTYLNLLFIMGWVLVGSAALVSIFWTTCKLEDHLDGKVSDEALVPLCLLAWCLQAGIIGGHMAWIINKLDSLWFPVLP